MVILLHGDDLHPMFGSVVVERRMDGLLRQNGTGVQPGEDVQQGAFAGAGGADNGDGFASTCSYGTCAYYCNFHIIYYLKMMSYKKLNQWLFSSHKSRKFLIIVQIFLRKFLDFKN